MKYQVLQYGDKYAVRKKWFNSGKLVDLKNPQFSWDERSSYYRDCFGSKERTIEVAKIKSQEISGFVIVAEF